MKKETYTTSDLIKKFKFTEGYIRDITRKKKPGRKFYLRIGREDNRSGGIERVFSSESVIRFLLLRELVSAGVERKTVMSFDVEKETSTIGNGFIKITANIKKLKERWNIT